MHGTDGPFSCVSSVSTAMGHSYRCDIVCFNGSMAPATQGTAGTHSVREVTFDPESSTPQAMGAGVLDNGVQIGTRSCFLTSPDLTWITIMDGYALDGTVVRAIILHAL